MKAQNMKIVYTYKVRLFDIVQPKEEFTEEQDQTFEVQLFENGNLSLKFYSIAGALVSRISIPLKMVSAVETFCEPGADIWLFRVSGNQIPLVLPLEECQKLMSAIDVLS